MFYRMPSPKNDFMNPQYLLKAIRPNSNFSSKSEALSVKKKRESLEKFADFNEWRVSDTFLLEIVGWSSCHLTKKFVNFVTFLSTTPGPANKK